MTRTIAVAAGLAACIAVACEASAAVVLQDRAGLARLLQDATPCCIVDARSDANRMTAPLADATPYHKGLRINPTSVVVVVADTDAKAVEIGRALAASSRAKDVVAVKGGVATWRSLVGSGASASGKPDGITFVIPRNTCEQSPPLQTLTTKQP
jgi:hypothetical protein